VVQDSTSSSAARLANSSPSFTETKQVSLASSASTSASTHRMYYQPSYEQMYYATNAQNTALSSTQISSTMAASAFLMNHQPPDQQLNNVPNSSHRAGLPDNFNQNISAYYSSNPTNYFPAAAAAEIPYDNPQCHDGGDNSSPTRDQLLQSIYNVISKKVQHQAALVNTRNDDNGQESDQGDEKCDGYTDTSAGDFGSIVDMHSDSSILSPAATKISIPNDSHSQRNTSSSGIADGHTKSRPHTNRPLVDHAYRDFSRYLQEGGQTVKHKKAGVNFPSKLHQMLSEPRFSHMIVWMVRGWHFKLLNKERLMTEAAPTYFVQTQFGSFTRQLKGWGFKRHHKPGADFACYYHECFLRGLPRLTWLMKRVPPNQGKTTPFAEGEPNFYLIPLPTPAMTLGHEDYTNPMSARTQHHMRLPVDDFSN